ncbi:MAG: alpha/beta fold hydrolase [Stellaceae bacterium]
MASTLRPASRFPTVNGLHLRILDWGKGDAPPILCVHEFTSSAEAFNAPARHWQDRFHVLAPAARTALDRFLATL